MVILVFGSRDWTDGRVIMAWLSKLPKGTRVVHGAARGADLIAGACALNLGLEVTAYPVDQKIDGPWPAAGILRNKRMLESEPHVRRGLGFSWIVEGQRDLTRGSRDMAARLIERGIPVTVVPPGAMP